MGATGFLIILTQLFVYPALDKALGPLQITRCFTPIVAVLIPLMPAATFPTGAEHSDFQLWFCLVVGRVVVRTVPFGICRGTGVVQILSDRLLVITADRVHRVCLHVEQSLGQQRRRVVKSTRDMYS